MGVLISYISHELIPDVGLSLSNLWAVTWKKKTDTYAQTHNTHMETDTITQTYKQPCMDIFGH